MKIELEASWKEQLCSEFDQDYMKQLKKFLTSELDQGKTIYPHGKEIFSAFNSTTFGNTKVIILGQDPYHGPNQAHGLSFSVKPGIKTPPSLLNIYKELHNDLGVDIPSHGYLRHWANQGVLLLNTVLTVEKSMAGSHRGKGWEIFTDKVIEILNEKKNHLVFLLWGSPAQKKAARLNQKKHLVLKSVHPSPLSAHRGFFGNHHFSKTNHYLTEKGRTPIDWSLPSL